MIAAELWQELDKENFASLTIDASKEKSREGGWRARPLRGFQWKLHHEVSNKNFSEILPSNGLGLGPSKVGQGGLKVLHLWRHS